MAMHVILNFTTFSSLCASCFSSNLTVSASEWLLIKHNKERFSSPILLFFECPFVIKRAFCTQLFFDQIGVFDMFWIYPTWINLITTEESKQIFHFLVGFSQEQTCLIYIEFSEKMVPRIAKNLSHLQGSKVI